MPKKIQERDEVSKKKKKYLDRDEELDLLLKAKCGDKMAWGRIYDQFFDAITGFINGWIRNEDDAKDIAQDTFIIAEKGIRECKYKPEYRFYTFLRVIAKRVILDHFKEVGKTVPVDTEEAEKETGERATGRREKGEETVYIRRETLISNLPNLANEDETEEFTDSKLITPPKPPNEIEKLETLHLTLLCCAKPHQVLVFGFIELLKWRPREVEDGLSDWTLGKITEQFFNDYYLYYQVSISRQAFYKYCSPLFEKLKRPVEKGLPELEYEPIRRTFPGAILEKLRLRTFYGERKPTLTLADWVYKIRPRVANAVETGRVCSD
jgi:DNA-directed RNA polymerase specialized sigma24 family protein